MRAGAIERVRGEDRKSGRTDDDSCLSSFSSRAHGREKRQLWGGVPLSGGSGVDVLETEAFLVTEKGDEISLGAFVPCQLSQCRRTAFLRRCWSPLSVFRRQSLQEA